MLYCVAARKRLQASLVAIFGSIACNEARPDSGMDVLVQFPEILPIQVTTIHHHIDDPPLLTQIDLSRLSGRDEADWPFLALATMLGCPTWKLLFHSSPV